MATRSKRRGDGERDGDGPRAAAADRRDTDHVLPGIGDLGVDDEPSIRDALTQGLARRFADEPRGKGRPRSVAAHSAILIATLDLVIEVGYDGVSIEAVAHRAGVGKATVYRRWESKGELVIELLETIASATPTPDTGDTRRDIEEFVDQIARGIGHSFYGQILSGLAAELTRNQSVAEIFRENFLRPRRKAAFEIIERGIERGDLREDLDVELVLDLIVAPFYYRRIVSGKPITVEFGRAVVDHVISGITSVQPR